MISTPCLTLTHVKHDFTQGGEIIHVLRDINLIIKPGELVALVGPSGAGKSTLLQIAGLLEQPSSGIVTMDGQSGSDLGDFKRTELRRLYAGFVYQAHHLLPEFTALENVMMPQLIAGKNKKEATIYAEELLIKLNMNHRLKHRPYKLSGGEQQRVAIARALANNPKVLIADEPTGNLDPHTADIVFDAFKALAREKNVAALIATHNMDLAKKMTRQVHLKDGVLVNRDV
ncbi:MAG: ABC transporter ATP-binding protein [Alphaproteobacteria bacterium]|nr:ABC transporter ATP-binding protein [Alphaproteobacteria bacterium]